MFYFIWLTDLHHALNSAVCVWLAECQYRVSWICRLCAEDGGLYCWHQYMKGKFS